MLTAKSQYIYRLTLTYFTFRIILAVALATVSFTDFYLKLTDNDYGDAYIFCIVIYFTVAAFTQLFTLIRIKTPSRFALFLSILTDVIFCLLCMHFAGGFGSGLGILLLSPVAITGVFFYGTFALFIAAVSSLGLLAHIAWQALADSSQTQFFVSAGLLGILFFAVSLLTQRIARHIHTTEILIDQQQELTEKLDKTNQLIVEKMQTGIVLINRNLQIKAINTSAKQLLGNDYHQGDVLVGKLLQSYSQYLLSPELNPLPFIEKPGLPLIRASFSSIDPKSKNGDVVIFLENQSLLNQQAQHIKLASLGRLSASIAHEIRNPLSTINHASQLLAESEHIDAADKRLLQMIENQAARLNNIISNVLNISRRTAANPQKVDLQQCILRTLNQLEDSRNIKISRDLFLEADPFIVPFDETQLQQVLTNLFVNAIVHSAKHSDDYWLGIRAIIKDNKPCLSVFDKGQGIKPEDVEKVFEPFYTTNASGTGLGLYISRDLCEMNQALLDYLYDEHGRGFFQIHFAHINRRLSVNE